MLDNSDNRSGAPSSNGTDRDKLLNRTADGDGTNAQDLEEEFFGKQGGK